MAIYNTNVSKNLKSAGFVIIEAQHQNETVEIKRFDDFLQMAKTLSIKFVFATPIYLSKQNLVAGREGNPYVAEYNQKVSHFMTNPIDIIYSFVYEGIWYSHKTTFADVTFERNKKAFLNNIPAYVIKKDYKDYPEETV